VPDTPSRGGGVSDTFKRKSNRAHGDGISFSSKRSGRQTSESNGSEAAEPSREPRRSTSDSYGSHWDSTPSRSVLGSTTSLKTGLNLRQGGLPFAFDSLN
jgi:hypothetical protein